MLLQNGADPNIRTNDNLPNKKCHFKTASEIAKIEGFPKIASIIGTLKF